MKILFNFIVAAFMSIPCVLFAQTTTFVFQTSTGRCIDASGVIGLNHLNVPHDGSDIRDFLAPLKNLQCVDFMTITDGSLDIKLGYTNFDKVDLRGANLNGAGFYSTGFTNCDLRGADLRNSVGNPLSFTGSNLSGADLRGANLEYAVLLPFKFKGVLYKGAVLKSAKYNDKTKLPFTPAMAVKLGMQFVN